MLSIWAVEEIEERSEMKVFFSMGRPDVSWAALSCLSLYEPNMRCLGSNEGHRIS